MGEKSGQGSDEHGGGGGTHGKVLNQIVRYAHAGKQHVEQRNDDDGSSHTEKAGKDSYQSAAQNKNTENRHDDLAV